jgi:hypothetical protein
MKTKATQVLLRWVASMSLQYVHSIHNHIQAIIPIPHSSDLPTDHLID